MSKIELKSGVDIYFLQPVDSYFGVDKDGKSVLGYIKDCVILKESDSLITIKYESRGKIKSDTIPKAAVIISHWKETEDQAKRRLEASDRMKKALKAAPKKAKK